MKTKRKLIPKTNVVSSSAGSGQHNVVGQSGYDNVCPSVSPNTQCAGHLSSLPYSDGGLEVFGLPDVALSVPPNSRCTRQLNSSSFRVQWSSTSVIPPAIFKFLSLSTVIAFVYDELLLQSTRGDNVNTHSDVSGELCHRTDHVADANVFPNRSSGLQERNTCSRTRQESTIGRNSLRGQSRVSGPPSDYKHIGNCTYSCQHCGALFWYEERLKSSMPRGSRPRYNRTVCEKIQDVHIPNFKVRLYNVIGTREYELPTRDMLGVIFYDPGPETDMDYDIILEERSGSENDLSYWLLFQTKARRLFQQYVVTAFCAIEHNRIDYIREHQNDIRNEYLFGIYDAINRGDSDGYDCGSRLILPQSFTGGSHFMYSHYLDALAICRVHGNPSFFITYTSNVKWPKITEYMDQFLLLTTTDRADVLDRVFEMKIHQLMNFLRDAQRFGKTVAVLYTVEFQKRGLPHCHTLLWIDESARVRKEEDIDVYISAELPPEDVDPECYRVVLELMMHGPCGLAYPSASCTQNSTRCKKYFPKEYCNQTYTDKSGFVHYKRRDTCVTTSRQNVELDNRYVVPYNKKLLMIFYAYINVEYFGWTTLIKYLFKYISEGTDRIVARMFRNHTDPPVAHK
ncbi:DNA helicase [Tanacetum coccineum]